ncbi:MBL fold metallo-hydrolase [Aliikangiella maris]|uniref:MBL fold metallo-hydrolase n=2 Tax=Aliikangiella maris TaxID=3162458 RepID=A0ABV3MJY5_9GAMM
MSNVKVCSLGSGSKGNATLIQFDQSIILVDSGFSSKELESRLTTLELRPADINAILVTHEHSDHFNGVPVFSNKFNIPVWMSPGTSLHPRADKIRSLNLINIHDSFELAGIQILPVAVPHDSREACQFVFHNDNYRIGILTDLGHVTQHVISCFAECDALLLEFNHDITMLMQGNYPASLKARVGGNLGHLNNQQALNFLHAINKSRLKLLAAMHLSEENNCPELVKNIIQQAELEKTTRVILADQQYGFEWVRIE